MVNHINEKRSAHIVTIEDPIEYLHPHKSSLVNQREIGTDTESFQAGLKFVLRQDPDVVLLGELRDVETIHTAMTVAETGHLTLSTLHTNSAAQTIHRVILAHPPHQQAGVRTQLSMILEGILSQRLVPNLTGKGRVLALEILVPTPAIRNLIREDKIHQIYSMMQTGQAKHGMQTMNQSLVDLFKQQLISAQSAMAFSSYPEELVGLLERAKGAETSRSSLMQIRTHR
jgi:twitching motility protein PilT